MIPANFINQVRRQARSNEQLDDESLREASLDLAFQARQSENVGPLLVPGFALVIAAATRHLGMTHYDVQLAGGRAMSEGHIVEMRTGEGKTLTATLPSVSYTHLTLPTTPYV